MTDWGKLSDRFNEAKEGFRYHRNGDGYQLANIQLLINELDQELATCADAALLDDKKTVAQIKSEADKGNVSVEGLGRAEAAARAAGLCAEMSAAPSPVPAPRKPRL